MAFTLDDFDKIWASTSPLTPYEFSDSNYQQGWNFVGSTPPARQMWDSVQKLNDEKTQYLYNAVFNGDVERVQACSISASTGYIQYTSGLQIVWGSIERVETTAIEETYAVPFSAYPSVVATANSNATIYINANNSTRFTVRTASGATTVRYIAIGKWN